MLDRELLFVFLTILIIYYTILSVQKYQKFHKKYPPGPIGFPILGHLPLLGTKPWEVFLKWKKIYGPIFSIRMGSFRAIVLTDPKIIREAFALQEFSGRPKLPFFAVLEGKEQRQFSQKCLKSFQITKLLEEKTLEEMDQVFRNLQKETKNWKKPFKVNQKFNVPTLNALWSLFMGRRFDQDDPQVWRIAEAMHDNHSLDGIFKKLFYFIPCLMNRFPGLGGLNKGRESLMSFYGSVRQELKREVKSAEEPTNFMEAFQHEMKIHKNNPNSSFYEPHDNFTRTTSDIIFAAMETTSTAITWFILLMTRNPQVQARLYEEVKNVVGHSRPPALSDRPHCPFAEAVVNEVLRFSCLLPVGIFHRTLVDIKDFHGYNIPAQTMVIADFAGIHNDPDLWHRPKEFDPSRFIDKDGKFRKSDNLLPFSTGKRSCIGETIGRSQLFLYVTGIVQRFEISHPVGKIPSAERVTGVVTWPKDFQVYFKERY